MKSAREILSATKYMDWQMVIINGGPPCFHIGDDGLFCGLALGWQGHCHPWDHDFVSLTSLLESMETYARADLIDRIIELEGHKTDFINRGKRLDEVEQQLKEAVEFAEGVLQVCEFLDNSDNHYTKHTQEHLAKLNAFLASQKDAKCPPGKP